MAKMVARAKKKTLPAKQAHEKKGKEKPVVFQAPSLVAFSYHDVAYQIDVEKSKVYKRFIEIEKSKQFSIINAYRAVAGPSL
jgi:hypothetical protein